MSDPESRTLRIGEVARVAGVSTHTIRYYERTGVLPEAPRTPTGYRAYAPETVERLAFIRKAQALGLRLAEVKEILEISEGGRPPCEHVRRLMRARLAEVERRLEELRSLRQTLRETLRLFDRAPPSRSACGCAVIEAAGSP